MPTPKKPTRLKLVTGTYRADRATPNEPQPARASAEPPPGLSAGALAAWGRLFPVLHRMGVVTEADAAALARMCECCAEMQAATESLARPVLDLDGTEVAPAGSLTYTTRSASGGVMVRTRPEVAARAAAERRFQHWLTQFGLTPAARSRVSAVGEREKDPADEYFVP